MKQFLFIIITICTFHSQCLAVEEELNPGNGVAAPILMGVYGAEVYVDASPTAPHFNTVHTPTLQDTLTVAEFLSQPGATLMNVTCGTLEGKGWLEGANLNLRASAWNFHGTVFCQHVCTITTRSPIHSVLNNTQFTGGGRVIIRRVDAEGNPLGEHEFQAHPLIFN